jgi:hypothetical protein
MGERKIDSPHGLLIHFLGQTDKYKGIIIIAVENDATTPDDRDKSGLVLGIANLPGHEVMGALQAALIMEQEDYRDSYLEHGEEPEPEQ